MAYSNITLMQIREMAFALRTSHWILRFVHADDALPHGESRAIPITYDFNTFLHPKTVRYLRAKNMEGRHIYGRPDASQYILIDDLDEDALDQLRSDGLRPAVSVQTSKGNFQSWIKLSKEPLSAAEYKAASRLLAYRYRGDMRSAQSNQLGRLPGFTNRKPMYEQSDGTYPFTRLKGKCTSVIQPGAEAVLCEAREIARNALSCASFTHRDGVLSQGLSHDEAKAMYGEAVSFLFDTFGQPQFSNDRSRLDFAVAKHLLKNEVAPDDCVTILISCSEKAQERGIAYVERTVEAAKRTLSPL